MTTDPPQLNAVHDIPEFMALLRQMKVRSGRTLRQLEDQAAAHGDVLARSTIADALRRSTLPRPELLIAFVRACGEEERIEEWSRLRERLATGGHLSSQVVELLPTPKRRRRTLAVLIFVLLVVTLTVSALSSSSAPDDECTEVLSIGHHGLCVVQVQEQLHEAGFQMPVDGAFGPYTKMRVVAYQVFADLPTTGMVDSRTRNALAENATKVSSWLPEQIEERVRRAFPEAPERAIDLVRCLSHADPLSIIGKQGGTREWGLFQLTDEEVLFDFRVDYTTALDTAWNIQAARTLWERHGFARWTCVVSPATGT